MDHAIIRAHQGDGASAWQALRAVYAGAASSRSGLISAFDALKVLQVPGADNFAQTADKVSVQIGYIRNNRLIKDSTASDLLDIIQLATIMQMLSVKPLYAGLVTTLRTDEHLTLATLRAKVTEFERASSIPMNGTGTLTSSHLRNGDAAAGAYAAGLSAGQAMVAQPGLQPAAAKPVKAPKAKHKFKYATNHDRAKHDPEFKATLAGQECYNWVRGTCPHGNDCLRRHSGRPGRDPNYKKLTTATNDYQQRNADNRSRPPGGSYYAGRMPPTPHFQPALSPARQPAWYDQQREPPAAGMHHGF